MRPSNDPFAQHAEKLRQADRAKVEAEHAAAETRRKEAAAEARRLQAETRLLNERARQTTEKEEESERKRAQLLNPSRGLGVMMALSWIGFAGFGGLGVILLLFAAMLKSDTVFEYSMFLCLLGMIALAGIVVSSVCSSLHRGFRRRHLKNFDDLNS